MRSFRCGSLSTMNRLKLDIFQRKIVYTTIFYSRIRQTSCRGLTSWLGKANKLKPNGPAAHGGLNSWNSTMIEKLSKNSSSGNSLANQSLCRSLHTITTSPCMTRLDIADRSAYRYQQQPHRGKKFRFVYSGKL